MLNPSKLTCYDSINSCYFKHIISSLHHTHTVILYLVSCCSNYLLNTPISHKSNDSNDIKHNIINIIRRWSSKLSSLLFISISFVDGMHCCQYFGIFHPAQSSEFGIACIES